MNVFCVKKKQSSDWLQNETQPFVYSDINVFTSITTCKAMSNRNRAHKNTEKNYLLKLIKFGII